MRNFKRDGGGSIRMYGVLNALANEDNEVIFISNAMDYSKFHPRIKHYYINYELNAYDKRIFQGLLSFTPAFVIYYMYKSMFVKIEEAIKNANGLYQKLYFFEYLDNSIGYVMKKKNIIDSYVNDIHGVATIEFEYQKSQEKSILKKTLYSIKFLMANKLDRKVFEYCDYFIFTSLSMKKYYEAAYPKVKDKQFYILPNLLSDDACKKEVDEKLKQNLKVKFGINKDEFVFFFAGGYKPTAGVEDLIYVFKKLVNKYVQKKFKLVLIGHGPSYKGCVNLSSNLGLEDNIVFIEKIPYNQLLTYQNIANIIVNPDRQNAYSELIIHLKYFDALISGCLVVNGDFASVREINKEKELSLTFTPSNIDSLFNAVEYSFLNFTELKEKYQTTRKYTCENLTYKSYIHELYKY
jgi:glycosyltransferase involved in cell wall biosynthesis